MKKRLVRIGISLAILLASSAPAFASEEERIEVQGRIMYMDAKKGILTVNERTFILGPSSIIQDEKGISAACDKLAPGKWVSLEGVREKTLSRRNMVRRIRLLPM